jgi:HSP20 family protein
VEQRDPILWAWKRSGALTPNVPHILDGQGRSKPMRTDVPIQSRVPDFVRELRRTQSEMNRLFGGLRVEMRPFPAVNVWAGQDGAIVTAAIPGVDPERLDVTVQPDAVLLRGTRSPEDVGENAVPLRTERAHGSFSRTVVLPFRIEPGKVTASFKLGILTLELPRPEDDRPRHIKLRPTQGGAPDKSEKPVQSSEPRKQQSSKVEGTS